MQCVIGFDWSYGVQGAGTVQGTSSAEGPHIIHDLLCQKINTAETDLYFTRVFCPSEVS